MAQMVINGPGYRDLGREANSLHQYTHEKSSDRSDQPVDLWQGPPREAGGTQPADYSRFAVLDGQSPYPERDAFGPVCTRGSADDRCQPVSVGSANGGRSTVERNIGDACYQCPYQPPRAAGSQEGITEAHPAVQGQEGPHVYRQYSSHILHRQAGGYKSASDGGDRQSNLQLGREDWSVPESETYSWKTQCHSRWTEQKKSDHLNRVLMLELLVESPLKLPNIDKLLKQTHNANFHSW